MYLVDFFDIILGGASLLVKKDTFTVEFLILECFLEDYHGTTVIGRIKQEY
jgi:hypothetical protein